jgi:hypothetical protein
MNHPRITHNVSDKFLGLTIEHCDVLGIHKIRKNPLKYMKFIFCLIFPNSNKLTKNTHFC